MKRKTKLRPTSRAMMLRNKPKPKTNALARRAKTPAAALEIKPTIDHARMLAEGASLDTLGLAELKLTAREEAVLNEPVPIDEVEIKPSGHPYLSHPGYTRWLNRAFGRMGWALVPVGKPALTGRTVTVPYLLYVHRSPVAFAWGEQDYHETNREQTYGDALESTVASALRRCAKRLGVGLDLWDRAWLDRFIDERAIRVKVKPKNPGDRPKTQWRLKTRPPFWNEIGRAGAEELEESEPAQRRERPRTEQPDRPITHAKSGEPITLEQRQRLVTIVRNSGRSEADVVAWLQTYFGVKGTAELLRRDYEFACKSIEASRPLPVKR